MKPKKGWSRFICAILLMLALFFQWMISIVALQELNCGCAVQGEWVFYCLSMLVSIIEMLFIPKLERFWKPLYIVAIALCLTLSLYGIVAIVMSRTLWTINFNHPFSQALRVCVLMLFFATPAAALFHKKVNA